MKQYCALCKSLLKKENKSLAHFIPQSIGGTLKSYNVLCSECNKKANDLFDIKIYDNFKYFAVILNSYRDRGKHKNLSIKSTNGTKLLIKPNGIVSKENWFIRNGKEFIIYFENLKDLENIKKKFLSRIKYTFGESQNTDQKSISKEAFFKVEIPFFTGDSVILKGIVLMAYLFYLEEVKDFKYVDKIAEFIIGIYPGNIVFAYPLISISPEEISDNKIYHNLLLIGDQRECTLICIVELFSTFRYKVILSSSYSGHDIYKYQSINIFSGKIVENNRKFTFNEFLIPRLNSSEIQTMFITEFKKIRRIMNRKLLKNQIGKKLLFDIDNIPAGTIVMDYHIELLNDENCFSISYFSENKFI